MSETPGNRPPLDVEQAIDVVLAAAAHRSRDERHREFGKWVLERYFTSLREECKADLTAKGYLDNLIASMASAVRAFSVERDIFATRWSALEKEKQGQIEAANRILDYAPLKEKGVWGKAIGAIGGSGMLVALRAQFLLKAKAAPWIPLAFAAAGAVIGIVLLEILVNLYHDRQRDKIEDRFPDRIQETWRTETLVSYRRIMRQFLISALKIREEYYPDLSSVSGMRLSELQGFPHVQFAGEKAEGDTPWAAIDASIDPIIERHFAFDTKASMVEYPVRLNFWPFNRKKG